MQQVDFPVPAGTVFAQVGPNREAFQPGTEPHGYVGPSGLSGPPEVVSPLNPAGAPTPTPISPAAPPKAIKPTAPGDLNGLF